MVAQLNRQRLILPVAPLAAAAIGLATALIFALMPVVTLESLILRSGIPAIVSAAEPPLGVTARLVLILIGGGGVAAIAWFALFLLIGSRTIALSAAKAVTGDDDSVPVLRRADAHPDAPARRPLFANQDLGTPFLEVHARGDQLPPADLVAAQPLSQPLSQAAPLPAPIAPIAPPPMLDPLPIRRAPVDLPDDFDLPLSAFDPQSIRAQPLAPPAPPPLPLSPSLRPQTFDPGERFETFELTPMVRPDNDDFPPAPRSMREARDTQATITALLERLERGVSHRGAPAPHPSRPRDTIEDTLGSLRRMATRNS